jgi:hypothetical protein
VFEQHIETTFFLKKNNRYIPLLPASLSECLALPTPFLMGAPRSILSSEGIRSSLIGVVVVDLDLGRVLDESADSSDVINIVVLFSCDANVSRS